MKPHLIQVVTKGEPGFPSKMLEGGRSCLALPRGVRSTQVFAACLASHCTCCPQNRPHKSIGRSLAVSVWSGDELCGARPVAESAALRSPQGCESLVQLDVSGSMCGPGALLSSLLDAAREVPNSRVGVLPLNPAATSAGWLSITMQVPNSGASDAVSHPVVGVFRRRRRAACTPAGCCLAVLLVSHLVQACHSQAELLKLPMNEAVVGAGWLRWHPACGAAFSTRCRLIESLAAVFNQHPIHPASPHR